MTKTLIVGDIHGCYDQLQRLLVRANWQPGKDILISVGDILDRGPASLKVLRWCQETPNVRVLLGNHEEKYIRYHKTGNVRMGNNKKLLYGQMVDSDIRWLESLSYLAHIPRFNLVITHAGIDTRISDIHNQTLNTCTHLRYVHKDTLEPLKLTRDEKTSELHKPLNSVYWTETYTLPYNVVYGHHVHDRGVPPKIVTRPNGTKLIGLDTGVCFEDCQLLSGYVVETELVVYTK